MRAPLWVSSLIAGFLFAPAPGAAQELEPRAYAASPVGANFVAAGYGYTWGPVLLDPSLPVQDVKAKVHIVPVGYGRTFGVAGMQGLVTATLPFVVGHVSGKVFEADSAVTRTGLGDFRSKISLNVIGSPALDRRAFASRPRSRWIAGSSLTVIAPTGQYLDDKLVNIGSNRWAFKPEVGVSSVWWRKLYLEAYAGVWLYTANHAFFPGTSTRQQKAITSLQAHASYAFHPHDWVALDYTWYGGGGTITNGGAESERLNNSRIGITGSLGLEGTRAIKLTASAGASGRSGSNFRTVAVAYQITWF